MKVIFLDIDGCLNRQHFGKDEQSRFGFDSNCVNALKYVFIHVPDARIVITSSWRFFETEPRVSKTVPWREELESRLNRPGVILGETPQLEGGKRPGSPALTRADEILEYMKAAPRRYGEFVEEYVVVDDETSCYKGTALEDHVVDCEIKTGRGLDLLNARRAVEILNGAPGRKPRTASPDENGPSGDAKDMARTLRKINAELERAARRESGGYSVFALLPRLCEIMYACKADYKNERYD